MQNKEQFRVKTITDNYKVATFKYLETLERQRKIPKMAIIFESLILDAGVIAVCTLTAIYFYFKRSWTYWKKRNVAYVEPTFPFGNFSDVILQRRTIGEAFKRLYDQLDGEKYAGTYMFTKAGFLFRDPEIIKNVLVKDFSNFHDRGFYINEEREPLSGHLFLLPGNKWRNLRVKLTPTFTSGKMKMMFQTLVDCGQELAECLTETANNEEVIEIKDVVARFSTDVISSCAFGIQCNCLKNPDAEFRQWGRKIFQPSIKDSLAGFLSFMVPALLDIVKLRVLDKNVAKYFRNMVEDTVNYREKNSIQRNDFMQLLIQLKNKGVIDTEYKNSHQNGHTTMEEKSDDNMMIEDHGREYPQGEVLPIGNMKINSMSELRRLAGVKSMGDAECPTLLDIEICSEQDDPRQRPNFGVKCKIFELDACQGIGKVCLVYLHKSECELLKREDPKIWLLDRSFEWHYLAADFMQYFRMMLVHQVYYNLNSRHIIYFSAMSMNCLAAQSFVFFAAGFETSSTTIQFCLYELCINPDIQERVRQEIDEILNQHDGKITYEAVQQMGYLDKVVSETLRKYPPLPMLNRECTQSYQVPGTDIVLNKGDLTVIPVLGLHHDPKYYPNPEKFDPERFSEEEKAKRHHYVYLPFGEGPRICIGMRFGLMQTKVGLISLLSKYEFSVSKETPIPLVMEPKSIILSPVGGMHLQIKKRVK
ncbi:hypothetical protein ANN_23437 [Periplaneta americana]|uniref:Cytochrome P450 n=1 Tax=Periplaneta americana TaxID=6978 RepID=A0ABQ8SM46_PERAM|nr:hypothetical protein ANN_23437 [Periplaneta americana]